MIIGDHLPLFLCMTAFYVQFRRSKTAPASVGVLDNAYVAEDGVTPYVAEDGVTPYVTET
jgi:hypothetical protein